MAGQDIFGFPQVTTGIEHLNNNIGTVGDYFGQQVAQQQAIKQAIALEKAKQDLELQLNARRMQQFGQFFSPQTAMGNGFGDTNAQPIQQFGSVPAQESSYQKMNRGVQEKFGQGFQFNPNAMFGDKEVIQKNTNPANDISNQTPEEVRSNLQQTNPSYLNYLDKVGTGEIQIGGRSTKQQQKILQDVAYINPGLDQSKIQARYKTRNDFTSGKESLQIKSLNTAVNHLGELNDLIPKLSNTNMQFINAPKNFTAKQFGDPAITRFETVKNALAGELATIFKNTGGTDTEIKNIGATIDASGSPEQLKGNIQQAVNLMYGRLNAIQDKWKNSFDQPNDPEFPIISDRSKNIIAGLGLNENSGQVQNNSQQNYLQEGQTATNPTTGKKIIYKGGQWQAL
jgi:hypothetical protein